MNTGRVRWLVWCAAVTLLPCPEDAAEGPSEGKPPHGAAAPEARGWKAIRLEGVPTYPHRINPLSLLPDGRLYGTGDDYVGTFLFDPRTDQTVYCGPRVGLAPYTTGDKRTGRRDCRANQRGSSHAKNA